MTRRARRRDGRPVRRDETRLHPHRGARRERHHELGGHRPGHRHGHALRAAPSRTASRPPRAWSPAATRKRSSSRSRPPPRPPRPPPRPARGAARPTPSTSRRSPRATPSPPCTARARSTTRRRRSSRPSRSPRRPPGRDRDAAHGGAQDMTARPHPTRRSRRRARARAGLPHRDRVHRRRAPLLREHELAGNRRHPRHARHRLRRRRRDAGRHRDHPGEHDPGCRRQLPRRSRRRSRSTTRPGPSASTARPFAASAAQRHVVLSVCPAAVAAPCPDASALLRADVIFYDDSGFGRAVSIQSWSN